MNRAQRIRQRRATAFAGRFTAETVRQGRWREPTDDAFAKIFADCVRPAEAALYPAIRTAFLTTYHPDLGGDPPSISASGPAPAGLTDRQTSPRHGLDDEARCRLAATAQGLDPIVECLTAEGIPHSIGQTTTASDFDMVVRIPLREPSWIGVTGGNAPRGRCWCIAHFRNDADDGNYLLNDNSYRWDSADDVVAAIQEEVDLAAWGATRSSSRLVNAYVVYAYPTRQGQTETLLGGGAWGRPEDALDIAQRERDIYHEHYGALPLNEAPWHREGGYGAIRISYHPPRVAVGIEIHDVDTGEQWFVPATGAPLGLTPTRHQPGDVLHWHPRPTTREDAVQVDQPGDELPTPQREPPLQPKLDDLRHRLNTFADTNPPVIDL